MPSVNGSDFVKFALCGIEACARGVHFTPEEILKSIDDNWDPLNVKMRETIITAIGKFPDVADFVSWSNNYPKAGQVRCITSENSLHAKSSTGATFFIPENNVVVILDKPGKTVNNVVGYNKKKDCVKVLWDSQVHIINVRELRRVTKVI